MKARVVSESTLMIAVVVAFALFPGKHAFWWISLSATIFSAIFIALEIMAFRAYWYLPPAGSVHDSLVQLHARMSAAARMMKVANIVLGFFIILVFTIDANFTNWMLPDTLVWLLGLKVMAWLFSSKWIAHAKDAREALREWTSMSTSN